MRYIRFFCDRSRTAGPPFYWAGVERDDTNAFAYVNQEDDSQKAA